MDHMCKLQPSSMLKERGTIQFVKLMQVLNQIFLLIQEIEFFNILRAFVHKLCQEDKKKKMKEA